MSSPKIHRKSAQEKNRKAKLSRKAYSFHVRAGDAPPEILSRPLTVPDLLGSGGSSAKDVVALVTVPKLTRLLLNVTIQRSPGALRVVMPLNATAEDLIAAALLQYKKEARLPALHSTDPSGFDLHYSQFSLESLDRGENLIALGSRNFFLYPRTAATALIAAVDGGGAAAASSSGRCSKVDKGCEKWSPWLKFMEFSL